MCMLPSYYGGNVDENTICGDWITPINIGQKPLMVTLSNGTQETIGDLYSYMTYTGTWYGTICLTCPWLMLVNATARQSITINVTNSGHPGMIWSSVVTRNIYNNVYRCGEMDLNPRGSSGPLGCKLSFM